MLSPELIRNARIQLRPKRMAATAIICAVISFASIIYFYSTIPANEQYELYHHLELMRFLFGLQIAALLIGGGIYCLQSIQREKDLNTFDYQRITRMAPVELVLGKLFGPPILMYFVVLCLMPAALWGAFQAQLTLPTVAAIYAILLVGAIAFHLLAVLISLLIGPGSSAGGILLYLVIAGMSSFDSNGSTGFSIHMLSPFFAYQLMPYPNGYQPVPAPDYPLRINDVFFGLQISHVLVLFAIYLTGAAWLFLAVTRNIKKEAANYEVYSPVQALLCALYLEFLVLGFFNWETPILSYVVNGRTMHAGGPIRPLDAESQFLAISLAIFAILGLSLLRNRDPIRRRIAQFGERASAWWAALWPAPYLTGGLVVAGLAMIRMISVKLTPSPGWNWSFGLLEVLFVAAWLARDSCYLQWMSLRRGRRPLLAGGLYLIVFYACTAAVVMAFNLFKPQAAPIGSVLIPSLVFDIDATAWADHRAAWVIALLVLFAETLLFAWLQRMELRQIAAGTIREERVAA